MDVRSLPEAPRGQPLPQLQPEIRLLCPALQERKEVPKILPLPLPHPLLGRVRMGRLLKVVQALLDRLDHLRELFEQWSMAEDVQHVFGRTPHVC